MKSDFPVETADVSALAQVPAVHACQISFFGLHHEKLSFTTGNHGAGCAYDGLKRLVPDEFWRVRPKQHLRSLPNRSGDKVVPPQLPSGRWFIFRSCRLPATYAYQVSHQRIALSLAGQGLSTTGRGLKIAGIPIQTDEE